MDDACVDKAVSYMKLLKDKIKNFKVQKARIATSTKQALGKAKKSGLWASLISKMVLAGGGNSSALTCNGATGPGADNLAALYTELTGCEANVNMSCSTELPEYNSTMEGMCSVRCLRELDRRWLGVVQLAPVTRWSASKAFAECSAIRR